MAGSVCANWISMVARVTFFSGRACQCWACPSFECGSRRHVNTGIAGT